MKTTNLDAFAVLAGAPDDPAGQTRAGRIVEPLMIAIYEAIC